MSPAGAIAWMRETFIEPSTRCLGRSVCEAHPTVGALVCTTCATDSRQTPSCNGMVVLDKFSLLISCVLDDHAISTERHPLHELIEPFTFISGRLNSAP